MIERLLIANRGEIACRIMRTAKKMGIKCIAVYSDVDEHAQHVQTSDEAYYIGPAPSQESYLNINKIVEVAKKARADAVHPGYGFLAENADFAAACKQAGVIFIGPEEYAIKAMGLKNKAKEIMQKANIPVIPGYHGDDQSLETLKKEAAKIGYPILLKASAGGGGKGMRIVENPNTFAEALSGSQREAKASFGSDKIILEKFLKNPRHIEFQIFADSHKNHVHLFERDCSIQRRYQKIIEETPATNFPEKLRLAMGKTAVSVAKAIKYLGAGTIEFLLDEQQNYYFMEMNTRLQVEHPITEMVTGIDLVEWQIFVAEGKKLPLKQSQIAMNGHAIEARIYAEDPEHEFLPSIGELYYYQQPTPNEHIRVDSGFKQNDTVSPFYDPLLAKLCVFGNDRPHAIQTLHNALSNFQVVGVRNNIAFLKKIISLDNFIQGKISNTFIDKNTTQLFTHDNISSIQPLILALLYYTQTQNDLAFENFNSLNDPNSPWSQANRFRLNLSAKETYQLQDKNKIYHCEITWEEQKNSLTCDNQTYEFSNLNITKDKTIEVQIGEQKVNGKVIVYKQEFNVFYEGEHFLFKLPNHSQNEDQDEEGSQLISPMPGTIVSILKKIGDKIERGERLIIIEAMKMEHTIVAPRSGKICEIFYAEGDRVDEGMRLLSLEEST